MGIKINDVGFDFFTVVMGGAGTGLAWRAAAHSIGASALVGELLIAVASGVFVVLMVVQILRAGLFWQSLKSEWRDVDRRNFFCAATISFGLISAAVLPYHHAISHALWWCGCVGQVIAFTGIFRSWFVGKIGISDLSPTWLIPLVGNASPSFTGVSFGYGAVCQVLLVTALVTWAIFLPLLIYKSIFVRDGHKPQPKPSVAILVSAPAVLAIAFDSLHPGADMVAYLTWTSLCFVVVVLSLSPALISDGFSKSWWAFTFPSAAISAALLRVYAADMSEVNHILADSSLTFCSLILVAVIIGSSARRSAGRCRVGRLARFGCFLAGFLSHRSGGGHD
ncbi:SLAC1 family transporter [Pseudomonas sp. TE21394]